MDPRDNTATTLEEIAEGEIVRIDPAKAIQIKKKIKFGHKFAITDIREGEYIIKYGEIIGRAKVNIEKGDHVHVRNVISAYMEGKKND